MWTVKQEVHGVSTVKREGSIENRLNDYYRRRCSNYERFLCDRVWECALCAQQAGKVEPLETATAPKAEALRRR